MSLDVYLTLLVDTGGPKPVEIELFSANITHNLNEMAREAGIYQALWRPEEIQVETAEQLIPLLKEGAAKLASNPKHYMQFDSPNGWGRYEDFLPWVVEYLTACEQHPKAKVTVSR